jgi:hypothetical protein
MYIGVSSKNNSEEHYEKINTLLMKNDSKLQYYYTDSILDIYDFNNPLLILWIQCFCNKFLSYI